MSSFFFGGFKFGGSAAAAMRKHPGQSHSKFSQRDKYLHFPSAWNRTPNPKNPSKMSLQHSRFFSVKWTIVRLSTWWTTELLLVSLSMPSVSQNGKTSRLNWSIWSTVSLGKDEANLLRYDFVGSDSRHLSRHKWVIFEYVSWKVSGGRAWNWPLNLEVSVIIFAEKDGLC